MATKQEIDQYLTQLKEKIRVFDVVFRPRDKNLTNQDGKRKIIIPVQIRIHMILTNPTIMNLVSE